MSKQYHDGELLGYVTLPEKCEALFKDSEGAHIDSRKQLEEELPPWKTVPENDTREKLKDDWTMPPFAYCGKYDLDQFCGDESDRISIMCEHIALRSSAITRAECEAEMQEWRDGTIIAKWTEAERERDEWKAKAKKYRACVASYECDLRCNEGQCNFYEEQCIKCDSPDGWCDEVMKAVES